MDDSAMRACAFPGCGRVARFTVPSSGYRFCAKHAPTDALEDAATDEDGVVATLPLIESPVARGSADFGGGARAGCFGGALLALWISLYFAWEFQVCLFGECDPPSLSARQVFLVHRAAPLWFLAAAVVSARLAGYRWPAAVGASLGAHLIAFLAFGLFVSVAAVLAPLLAILLILGAPLFWMLGLGLVRSFVPPTEPSGFSWARRDDRLVMVALGALALGMALYAAAASDTRPRAASRDVPRPTPIRRPATPQPTPPSPRTPVSAGVMRIAGPAITLSAPAPDQPVFTTMQGLRGQRVSLEVSAFIADRCCDPALTVTAPSGGIVRTLSLHGQSPFVAVLVLDEDGAYTLTLQPRGAPRLSSIIRAREVVVAEARMAVGDPPRDVTLVTAADEEDIIFSARAGQELEISIVGVPYELAKTTRGPAQVLDASGQPVQHGMANSPDRTALVVRIPADGEYRLSLVPWGATPAPVTVRITVH